jgi:predicted transcriptional regulator
MEEKTAIFQKVLDVTRPIVLTGDFERVEYEAQAFSNLYQRRENILSAIEKIDTQMNTFGEPERFDAEYAIQLAVINDKQRKIAAELIEIKKKNMAMYEKIKEHIKGDLKNVRQTMDVNEAYMSDFDTAGGRYFDQKN